MQLFQWDACRTPLHADTIDVFLTDLPFGKAHGSHKSVKRLMPPLVKELGRLLKPGGRGLIICNGHKIFSSILAKSSLQFTFQRIESGKFQAHLFEILKPKGV